LIKKKKSGGRLGLALAYGSDLWFKAHPKEEPMNHWLAAVHRGARRAPATRRETAIVTSAAERMGGSGIWSLAGSAETRRPKGTSNPGAQRREIPILTREFVYALLEFRSTDHAGVRTRYFH
jgi:hypothetical protein